MSSRVDFPLTFRLQVVGDQEIANRFNQVCTSTSNISNSANTVQTGLNNAGTALRNAGTSAATSATQHQQFGGALSSLNPSINNVSTGVETYSGSY